MTYVTKRSKKPVNRRSFIKKGLGAGSATLAAGLLSSSSSGKEKDKGEGSNLSKGDAAILRFLAAAGNTHFQFINAYLASKGAATVNLDPFRTLPSSKATGALQIGRLTNLMQPTVCTSWGTRYRSRANNPDLDPAFAFPQAVPTLSVRQHPAIPKSDADLSPTDHIQAIANTAGFHFAFIEQGGTSLYPSLAQRVKSSEVLRILLSIGPTETAHFQTWHDKAGNAPALADPTNPQLVFPDLNAPPAGGEDFQTNLIMPEPCPFLSRKFPVCSIIRPTQTKGAAMGAAKALTADGLFIGQSPMFFELLQDLAAEADNAGSDDD